MQFAKEEVAAIYVNESVICTNCMMDGEWSTMTEAQIITKEERDRKNKVFFCDRCGEPI